MISHFNVGPFLFIFSCILFLRVISAHKEPIKLISIENAVFLGFITFFVLPIGFLDNLPANYGVIVVLGYFAFLVSARLVERIWNCKKYYDFISIKDTKEIYLFCLLFVILFIGLNAGILIMGEVSSRIKEVWFESVPVRVALADLADKYYGQGLESASVLKILMRLLKNGFLIAWGVVFLRKPKLAVISWIVFIVLSLVSYQGRSAIAMLILAPIIAYILTRRTKKATIVLFSVLSLVIILVMLPVLENVRSGLNQPGTHIGLQEIKDQIFLTTAIPVGNAVLLEKTGYRATWGEYVFALAIRPIPVFLWPSKPVRIFNYESTNLIHQMEIGANNPISTFTMFGEGLYYGGKYGFLVLMGFFGLLSKVGEKIFSYKSGLFIIPLVYLIFNSAILLRSTLLDYYSYILNTIIPLAMLVFVARLLSKSRDAKKSLNNITNRS